MNLDNNYQPKEKDENFALWKSMDHTRFVIARLREIELAEYGLTPEQSHVLDILIHNGGSTTINKIVEITMRQHHSISTLIDRMSKQGLVKKRKNPQDKRQFDVAITPRGLRIFNHTPRDSIKRVFSELSSEDKAAFMRVLKQLLKSAYKYHGIADEAALDKDLI